MSLNTTPIFVGTPRTETAELTAANTARDGSGTLATLFTAGTSGSRVDFVTFNSAQATPAASSAMVGRVFVTNTSGLNPVLLSEIALPTITASNTVIGQTQTIFYSNGLLLDSGQQLRVAISVYAGVQDKFQVIARGGDY
jgi:hypothetical protein